MKNNMGKVNLLDCTLRDGGYINDWKFGKDGIIAIINKLVQTRIEMIEVGFLKGEQYDPDRTLFPNVETMKTVILDKSPRVLYVGMIDMSDPIPQDNISQCDGASIDGIRVIFKKNKIDEAYAYCERIKNLGYKLFVNFVSTDAYTDKEFIDGIERFNKLHPDGVTIVDTFGMIKRKHFKRLVAIADNNLEEDIMLCYHAHNNLQQAFGNAEAMVEMNLQRDICIDACVFGMGRGAGNLNLELFAEYMNDNYGRNYRITPMLEIMDEHLSEFYRKKFWGYSLPLYLSASHCCHPNYAIYLAEKNTLTEKSFHEILLSISSEDKQIFSKEKAEYYYRKYFENYVDDKLAIEALRKRISGRKIVVLAPGQSLIDHEDIIKCNIDNDTLVFSINFCNDFWHSDYIFTSNIRRFAKLADKGVMDKVIAASNIPDCQKAAYVVNFSTYIGADEEIFDNSGLMIIRLLERLGVREIAIGGMDGYNQLNEGNYMSSSYEAEHVMTMDNRNALIEKELRELSRRLKIKFITPTKYQI